MESRENALAWVDGLTEEQFIDQVKLRGLSIADIVLVIPYYPVARSVLFFDFLVKHLEPSQNDMYIYLRQINFEQLKASFLDFAKKTSFPSSMLAWLIKEKNLVGDKDYFDLFLASSPSASDFCWVFGEFPALKTREYIFEFMASKPNQYHCDYLVKTLGVNAEWLQDEDQVDRVLSFLLSREKVKESGGL
jgi:hypothetical protein